MQCTVRYEPRSSNVTLKLRSFASALRFWWLELAGVNKPLDEFGISGSMAGKICDVGMLSKRTRHRNVIIEPNIESNNTETNNKLFQFGLLKINQSSALRQMNKNEIYLGLYGLSNISAPLNRKPDDSYNYQGCRNRKIHLSYQSRRHLDIKTIIGWSRINGMHAHADTVKQEHRHRKTAAF